MSATRTFSLLPDRELASRYWAARDELERLRRRRRADGRAPSSEEMAGAFQRIRTLDAICRQLWRESLRRTEMGSLSAAS